MIAIAETDPPVAQPGLARTLLQGVPRSYAVLFFSADIRLGWVLLFTSLFSPVTGICGLLGVTGAGVLVWMLGFDRPGIRNGFCLFNPLLVSLTLGWLHGCYHFAPSMFAVLGFAGVTGSLFISIAMQQLFATYLGMSAHSLPAVLAAYVLYFLGFALFGSPIAPALMPDAILDLSMLPSWAQAMFQAFGAMLFLPRALPGVMVFVALALVSPLSCLVAAASFITGSSVMEVLGYPFTAESVSWCGFNFVLCGIALGSGYFIVSRASLALALCGAFLCALVSPALAAALRYFGLPSSALPYNLVVMVMVYALRQRRHPNGLQASPAPGALPESAARRVLLNARRFPHLQTPALHLPFDGERTVTQSFDGALTHRGAWRHAFDFEAEISRAKHHGDGSIVEDFHTFATPVLAPCAGVVAAAVGTVRDNTPGENNPEENWGNYVLLYADTGFYVMLAHLKQHSLAVHVGQRVERGTLLALCGNSGRSPVPHLHVQIQDTMRSGAVTRAFCLKHYLELGNDGAATMYRTSGVPALNARVRPALPDAALASLFAGWLPGAYRYEVIGDKGLRWEETLLLDFDESGRYRLRSRRTRARLSGFIAESVFYTTDFEGNDASLLAFIAVGLARVPCIADHEATWLDECNAIPFQNAALRWMHDFADPFLGPSILEGRYRIVRDDGGWRVMSSFAAEGNFLLDSARLPHAVSVRLCSRHFIEEMEVRLAGDRVLRARLCGHEPLQS